jgi:hypothetical protein
MKKNSQTLEKSIKRGKGRPKNSGEKWNPVYIEIVKELANEGYIESEIQRLIHISVATFNKWKKDHPEFLKALKAGKENPDKQVVKALFENALGGEYVTKKPIVVSDGSQVGSHIEMVEVKERIPANVTAQIYWTKNRLPKEWRDKVDLEHTGKMEYKVIPDEILEDKE